MAKTEDWDELREAWVDSGPAAPSIDVDALIRRVRWATRLTVFTVVVEVIITIGAVGYIGYDIATGAELNTNQILAIFLIGFTVLAAAWARIGPWTTKWETIEELAAIAEQRARASLRYAKACYWTSALATALLAFIAAKDAWAGEPGKNGWLLVVCFVYLGVLTAWTRRKERRTRKQLEEAQQIRQSFAAETPPS